MNTPPPKTEREEVSEVVEEAREKSVERASKLSSRLIHEVIRRDGEEELRRPFNSLFWSGVAAGVLISFSIIGKGTFRTYLPDNEWRHIIENAGYSFGFLLVMLGRMQLFTENTIMTVLPVMTRPDIDGLRRLARLWAGVLAANVIGCFIAATAMAYLPVMPEEMPAAIADLAWHVMEIPAFESFARGVPAGILIAALVWMLPQANAASFWVIAVFTWLIGVAGFTHIVAGSVEMAYLMVLGQLPLMDAVFGFFVPVLLGNVVGGTLIFTFLAFAQVRQELPDDTLPDDTG
ncbi:MULTISPECIES: formate/nitrite transporter family protein [unclassified Roseitalea]|uniref:formate/nitrite transporter family protein n=1 Tax=unclassified Roseitalea TaxID=2639107 RepID=UPI00273FDB4A|nr:MULTISPECIES: formate/nitrite transporter family protein [unclassified Roseitalea]